MKKESQKRSLLQRIHENANVSGNIMESLSPNIQNLMDNLRGADNTVRELAAGGDNGLSLKELLKASKKSLNNARYLQAVGYLGSFYNRFEDISKEFSRIKGLTEAEHLDFLSKGLEDTGRQHLLDLHKKYEKKQAERSIVGMNKFAGLFNLFNGQSKEHKGFKRWEKLNPSFTKELKNSIAQHINSAEKVYNLFIATLKEMGTLRASRKIEGYLKAIEKITRIYTPAKIAFENFYKTRIKSFVDKIREVEDAKPVQNVVTEVSEDTVVQDKPSRTSPSLDFPPIKPAYQNWGKAVSVPESKSIVETVPEDEFEEVNDDELEVTSPTKTEPMAATPAQLVKIEDEEDEIQLAKEPEIKPVAKPVQEKSPALTVPGVKALKPPTKRHQANELDEILKTHASKKISSYFEMRKRKVILKKALA